MLVLDANILIRAILGRVRQLVEDYAAHGVRFYAPSPAYADAEKYLPALLARRGKDSTGVASSLRYLQLLVEPLQEEVYENYEEDARLRLRGRDEQDWPILAAAFALNCPIWSEDTDFFGTGIAVWTSDRVEIFLRARVKMLGSEATGS